MKTKNQRIFEMLNKLVFVMTQPYCENCNSVAERLDSGEEICLTCHSKDLIRYLDNYHPDNKSESFYAPALISIKAEECFFENLNENRWSWFEEVLNKKFGRINICSTHYDSGTSLKKLDFKEFEKKMEKHIEDLLNENRIILINDKYYYSHQVEMLILKKTEELEKDKQVKGNLLF